MPGWLKLNAAQVGAAGAGPARPVASGAATHRAAGRYAGLFLVAAPVAILLALSPARAVDRDPASICDRAAAEASAATGVPISVLKAISLTETGRDRGGVVRPWPWTVNMEGKGVWFDGPEAALAYVYEHFKRGARSFDVGCFQVNYKWHHEHFGSIEEMFDPVANAVYAARFLQTLHTESGDWEIAAGAYHSRTPEYAERYRARFADFRAKFAAEDDLPLPVGAPLGPIALSGDIAVQPQRRTRVNTFPLFQGGGGNALGSLVPLADRGGATGLFARGGSG